MFHSELDDLSRGGRRRAGRGIVRAGGFSECFRCVHARIGMGFVMVWMFAADFGEFLLLGVAREWCPS